MSYCDNCKPKPAEETVKQKRTRAPSKYNAYFQEKMKEEEIKKLPHKERMQRIGEMWKNDKESYSSVVKGQEPAPAAPAPAVAPSAPAQTI
eukprot:g81771.t1